MAMALVFGPNNSDFETRGGVARLSFPFILIGMDVPVELRKRQQQADVVVADTDTPASVRTKVIGEITQRGTRQTITIAPADIMFL